MEIREILVSKYNITTSLVGPASVWRCAGRQEWRGAVGKIMRDPVIMLSSAAFILSKMGAS